MWKRDRLLLTMSLLQLVLISCSKRNNQGIVDDQISSDNTQEEVTMEVSKSESLISKLLSRDTLFRFSSKQSFEIDDTILEELTHIDSSYFSLFSGTEFRKYLKNDSHYFFSLQDTSSNNASITVIINTDYLWRLYLFTFNEDRILNYFELAGFGGDGLYTYKSYGRFTDENTYQRIELNSDLSNDNFVLVDSTIVTLKRQNLSYVQASKKSFEIKKEY